MPSGALRQARLRRRVRLSGADEVGRAGAGVGRRARRGFSIWHLREKGARPFYSETDDAGGGRGAGTSSRRTCACCSIVGHRDVARRVSARRRARRRRSTRSGARSAPAPFALINPGAAWPNKRWPPARFGEVAAFLREVRGLPSIVLWGPGEEALAQAVVAASGGAARCAPPTEIADLVALSPRRRR